MAITNQITWTDSGEATNIAPSQDQYKNDDWWLSYQFNDSTGVPVNLTPYAFGAEFYPAGSTTGTAITAPNGSVISTQAAVGMITVNVSKTLTAAQTPDIYAVEIPIKPSNIVQYNRLRLYADATTRMTLVISPIRILQP